MKADRKYLVVLLLAMFGVLAVTGAQRGTSPSSPGVLLAAPHEEDEREAKEREDQKGEWPEYRVIGLEHQPAPEAMETLQQLFKSEVFGEIRGILAFAVNRPANAIVIVGPEHAVDLLEGMLRELDELAAEHRERTQHREAEHRERMQHEHAERRERMEREEAARHEMEEREHGERREHGEGPGRRIERLRDLLQSPQLRKKHPDLRRRLMGPRDGDRSRPGQEERRRYMEQMRQMREQTERFFREYGRPRVQDHGSKPRVFEGPSFRFEFRPEIDRPKVKRL